MSASTPPQHRCPTCSSTSVNPRNLVVFIDGTSNKPGPKNTNVKKLHDHIFINESPVEQHIFYLEGIGAYEVDGLSLSSRMGKAIYSGLQVAFARNVEQNVQKAYRWLVSNYHHGDQIYLFGFSRGGYQVRALAGMIHEVGLLREHSEERVKQAYHRYVSIHPNNPKTKETAMQFKKDFCREGVRIHFVGVWDTVSSLGIIKKEVHITSSASVTNACHFRHALALDERRVKFMPEYFLEVNAHRSDIRSPRPPIGDVKEVWFAGCHSDVYVAYRF
ncbi:hypothetical protein OG21DRAFT_1535523 [Imleria badia]|nr:hypothetical protein OG21DRAFT_1535523 [Imleria badia]